MSRSPVRTRPVHTPSSLNRLVRATLEDVFPLVEIEGEIGSYRPAASGHWYFVLKDAQAEVRVSMFRSRSIYVRFKPANGDKVLVRGRLSLYEARGDYQLIAEHLEPAGLGDKLLALQRLKERLAAEGLFASEHKRPLPSLPRSLLVLTSLQGAALRDVLSVLARRFPLMPVLVWPALMQGEQAAAGLVEALQRITRLPQALLPQLLLLTRGGGSQEDLWCFNDEALARQIRQMPMPVIAAIGHEIDITLAELSADLRAATPTAAAELLSPDRQALSQRVRSAHRNATRAMRSQLERLELRLQHGLRRLEQQHPRSRLQLLRQRLVAVHGRQQRATELALRGALARLQGCQSRLRALHPQQRLDQVRQRLHNMLELIRRGAENQLAVRRRLLEGLKRTLYATSPQATLDRGYVLVFDQHSGRCLQQLADFTPGQQLRLRLADGSVRAQVAAAD